MRSVLAGALLVLALLVPSPAAAGPALKNFQLSGTYVLQADGKTEPNASIYHSARSAAYLVVSDVFEHAILVLQRKRSIEGVDPDELEEREDGGFDLPGTATTCSYGNYRLVGTDVTFKIGEIAVRLKLSPPLTGTHWAKKVVKHTPQYARDAKGYRPDPAKLKILAESETEARVQIFFGSWCGFCNKFLPYTLKVEEELKKTGTSISFEYHGLPPPPAAWMTKEATRMRVKRLMTGFVFVDGKQVGRIEGNSWIKPEKALAGIIK